MDKRQKTDTIVIHCTQTPKDMDIDVDKVLYAILGGLGATILTLIGLFN